MSDLISEELLNIEQLFTEGLYFEALDSLNEFEQKIDLTPEDQLFFIILKSNIFYELGRFLDALKYAHDVIKEIIAVQRQVKEKIGKEKAHVSCYEFDPGLLKIVTGQLKSKLDDLYGLSKEEKRCALDEICATIQEETKDNEDITEGLIKDAISEVEKEFVRKKILSEEKRPDSRALDEIRPLDCQVGVLPRTHGSAVFTRGQTQSLSIITLGTSSDEQTIESLAGRRSKHFMLHYSFPPFSVGEVKFLRGPSRREIGHGALAEKSLLNVILQNALSFSSLSFISLTRTSVISTATPCVIRVT